MWYTKAAHAGDGDAMMVISRLLENDDCPESAAIWLWKAADIGAKDAGIKLMWLRRSSLYDLLY
jgi:TPR repeat protein